MAAQRLPIDLVVEYRGLKPATSFTRRETGEKVDVAPRLKFELSRDDGDVDQLEVPASQLDRCEPPFDYSALKRGDHVRLRGDAVLQPKGAERESYLQVTSAIVVDAAAKPLRPAAAA